VRCFVQIIDYMFASSKGKARAQMLLEFYGPEFTLFNVSRALQQVWWNSIGLIVGVWGLFAEGICCHHKRGERL
jgi:hypothetical protein